MTATLESRIEALEARMKPAPYWVVYTFEFDGRITDINGSDVTREEYEQRKKDLQGQPGFFITFIEEIIS